MAKTIVMSANENVLRSAIQKSELARARQIILRPDKSKFGNRPGIQTDVDGIKDGKDVKNPQNDEGRKNVEIGSPVNLARAASRAARS